MASPSELRQFALECAKRAAATKDERLRKILLDIARSWSQAALEIERSIALEDDKPPPVPKQPKP